MTIPCQDCHDEYDDILSWINHRAIMHEESRREKQRESENS